MNQEILRSFLIYMMVEDKLQATQLIPLLDRLEEKHLIDDINCKILLGVNIYRIGRRLNKLKSKLICNNNNVLHSKHS